MILHRIALTRALALTHWTLDLAEALRWAGARVDHMMDWTHGHSLEMDEGNAAQRAGYWVGGKLQRAGDAVERAGLKLSAWFTAAQKRSPFTYDEVEAPLLR